MTTPPFLLAATLLFWGWQSDWLWVGALAAIVLEGARWTRMRWNFAQADLDRIFNLCTLLFLGSTVLAFANNDGAAVLTSLLKDQSLAARSESLSKGARSVILVFQWLPLTFLPLALAQAYSVQPRMDWSTFSLWLRRQRKKTLARPRSPDSGLNVLWPYFAACLLAASAANERTYRFGVGLVLLVGWALWQQRPRHLSAIAWTTCLVIALGLGFAAQSGLRELQRLLQRLDAALVARLGGGGNFSEKELRTMIGVIGRLKLSGSIVLRVETDGGSPPALLREASYNLCRSPLWAAVPRDEFSTVNSETNIITTILAPRHPPTNNVIVSSHFSGGEGLLAIPLGAVRLDDLIADVETNHLGVVRVKRGPGFARVRVGYQSAYSIDSAPGTNDLDVPNAEKPVLDRIITSQGIGGKSPEEKVRRAAQYFSENFRYSTWVGPGHRPGSNQTALTRFLVQTKSGHCEYFATAAALLLRQAGVPTRYAVGYSVQEKHGKYWVVRERHAHAWCLAWVNNAWRDVDATPASWVAAEDARASWWESISDTWSRIWFEFSKWRWGTGSWKRYLLWTLAPLLGLAAWRLMTQKQWRRAHSKETTSALPRPGSDSEFYLIEMRLVQLGLDRRAGETLATWLGRLDRERLTDGQGLRGLLSLHYRLRFDPLGITTEERSRLRSEANAWVQRKTA